MKNAIISGVIAVAMGLLAPQAVHSQGTLYVSSLDQPSSGTAAVGSDSWLAAEFRTGNNPDGYEFDSVQLAMASASGSPNGFTVMLYSAGGLSATLPESSLGTFSGSTDPATGGTFTYTASSLTLPPATAYFIVVKAGTSVANGAYAWSFDNSPPVTTGGWGGTDYLLNSTDGFSWNANFEDPRFSLTATAIPEPDTFVLMGLPGVLFLVWRRWRAPAQAR